MSKAASEGMSRADVDEKEVTGGGGRKRYVDYGEDDFDSDNLPSDKFDCIISLYSLDYHYDFKLYEDYLQRSFHQNSILIFDTIRPDYFLKLFDDVKIIASTQKKIHSSKRILCRGYKY